MLSNFEIILAMCITTIYFILPAYLANSGGLIFGGGTPIDFGKCDKKGERLIGDGATWKGLIGGTILGTIVGIIQGFFGPYILANLSEFIFTPICTNTIEGFLAGFLMSFGALIGDAIGSFIKRRIGIKRGESAPFLDQLDFLIVALIFVSLIIKLTLPFVILAIVLTLIIHLLANSIAYLLGLKDVWY
ncbi:MAG: CDP-2,3-bis-(O-geranylgeranyl)-sn-glycerol synthase [Methanobrevibacter sp.]|nr:CDP-2,3-bis-(O-geranylgeranyl)-sn-glycerol synthase [Methanobrevibacter sp.]